MDDIDEILVQLNTPCLTEIKMSKYAMCFPHKGKRTAVWRIGHCVSMCYVRDNYYDNMPDDGAAATIRTSTMASPPDSTTHINWVQHVYDTMRQDYVPMELFKALMNCGKEYAFYAINASDGLKTQLSVDYGAVPGLG